MLEYPFFQNFYCHIPNTNFAFLSISKNGCTFLKKVALYNKYKVWVKGRDETHKAIGYKPENSEFLFNPEDITNLKMKNSNLQIFAVWREPIERLVSIYKQFILEREHNDYFCWMGFYNRHVSFEEFLRFTEFELSKPDPLFQDEHIRKQTDCLGKPPLVDFIISLKDLFTFLKEKSISFVYEKSNKTKSDFLLKDKRLMERIKILYEEDYKIPINF